MPSDFDDLFQRFKADKNEEAALRAGMEILRECFTKEYQDLFGSLLSVGYQSSFLTSVFISHFMSNAVGVAYAHVAEVNEVDEELIRPVVENYAKVLSEATIQFQKDCLRLKRETN